MNQDIRQILAQNLKKLREKTGKSREFVAIALDFDNSYISKLEKGKINITLDKLITIADYFEIELVELFKK